MLENEQFPRMSKKHISQTKVRPGVINILFMLDDVTVGSGISPVRDWDCAVNNKHSLAFSVCPAQCWMIILFHPPNNAMRQVLGISPSTDNGTWGLEGLSNGVQVTELGRSRAEFWTQMCFLILWPWLLCTLPGLCGFAGPAPPRCRLHPLSAGRPCCLLLTLARD